MSKVETILESISSLTLLEAAELKKAIEDKFGVSAAAPMMMAAAPAAGGAAAAAEKTSFDAVLSEVGANKLQVVKVVKEITGLGLKEAKELVDSAPKEILKDSPKDKCEEVKKKIEEAGGKVDIK